MIVPSRASFGATWVMLHARHSPWQRCYLSMHMPYTETQSCGQNLQGPNRRGLMNKCMIDLRFVFLLGWEGVVQVKEWPFRWWLWLREFWFSALNSSRQGMRRWGFLCWSPSLWRSWTSHRWLWSMLFLRYRIVFWKIVQMVRPCTIIRN